MEPNSREFYKQCSFQKYCNAVLHNEACDAHRELRTHKAKEVTFRIGESKLRKLAEENPVPDWVMMNGNRIQIKRKQFEKMIDTVDAI